MSDFSGPPFRADHIGGLLRPADLLGRRKYSRDFVYRRPRESGGPGQPPER